MKGLFESVLRPAGFVKYSCVLRGYDEKCIARTDAFRVTHVAYARCEASCQGLRVSALLIHDALHPVGRE